MMMNNDPKWIKQKAEAEDGCQVSVGGLVGDIEAVDDLLIEGSAGRRAS